MLPAQAGCGLVRPGDTAVDSGMALPLAAFGRALATLEWRALPGPRPAIPTSP